MKLSDGTEISDRDISLLKEKFKDESAFNKALLRLQDHEPLAYILGEWYFYDEVYYVSPDCLIPRPDTEHLVDKIIKLLPCGGTFADLCTGSGCIAISALAHRPDAKAFAVDISEKALSLAKANAVRNAVSERIEFSKGNVLSEDVLGYRMFDMIVSNPPYIATDVIDTLEAEVLSEPRIALDGGSDGLLFYRRLLGAYKDHIKNGGFLIMEIGYDQGDALKKMCNCDIIKDYGGNDRVAILKIE